LKCYVRLVPTDVSHRAAIHAALGDPVRLAIIDDLSASDRSPSELGVRFELSGNLLAHHLAVLERVGLIKRLGSSGDRRRRYIRLVSAPLTDLGLVACPPTGRVLFVCTRNSARSQLAAALWVRHTGGPASSAGTDPSDRVHPGALAAATRAGLDLSTAAPRSLDQVGPAAQVVTVCDRAHELIAPSSDWWHWSIPDPVGRGTPAAFDATVAQLEDRMASITSKGTSG
jgi:protein-tyrosine-phosphatase